jgi:hypothetical protein
MNCRQRSHGAERSSAAEPSYNNVWLVGSSFGYAPSALPQTAQAGFAVYRNGRVLIKTILSGKYLPVFVEHLCHPSVKNKTNVIDAIKTEFKVRDVKII